MNLLEKLSSNLAQRISAKESNTEKTEIIQYGIYLLLSDIIKTTIVLSLSYFLGILYYALFAMISIGILRSLCGGVHAKTFWGCLISNSLIILITSYVSLNVIGHADLVILVCSFVTCVFSIYIYAPSDHENKPIRSKKQRKKLRTYSFITCFIYLVSAVFLMDTPYSVIIAFSYLVVSGNILPITYTITNNKSGDYYIPGDVTAKGT